MKLDYNWLKDYIKCDLSVNQIAEIMTSVGIEVDGVEETDVIEGGLKNVVVAKVLTCDIHPDSDHLHITTVDDGSGTPLQVVCGAPNVAAGQKVLFAKVGAVLPGDFKIKKSKIRGVESLGMICAEDELGIGESHEGLSSYPDPGRHRVRDYGQSCGRSFALWRGPRHLRLYETARHSLRIGPSEGGRGAQGREDRCPGTDWHRRPGCRRRSSLYGPHHRGHKSRSFA